MPIVSISKIQHRYGLYENLPQLSAAELAWAVDARRLFIGNGPTSEGAPTIGNTEILTQYSNLLEVAENAYSYKDLAVGFEAVTGLSLDAPITRNLQEKLDDFVSVRDYGAKGDGVTDDTDAINRALTDLYTRDTGAAVRRRLYFPAGNYKISDVIKIPPYATLQGEGKNHTIITATADAACVARIVDSKLQTGASIGSNGAVLPQYIAINDMTFNANSYVMDIFLIDAAKYVSFGGVGFVGGATSAPGTTGPSALRITSTAINHSSDILFDDCEFAGTSYAAVLNDDMENIVFDKSTFKKLFIGFKIGEDTLGTGASTIGPKGLRITNSLFDEIFSSAIYNYETASVTSAFNTYLDVGNINAALPTHPILILTSGNSSIGDVFDRPAETFPPRIEGQAIEGINAWGGLVPANVNIISNTGMAIGSRKFEYGSTIALASDVLVETATGVTFPKQLKSQRLYYTIERGTLVRQGRLDIIGSGFGGSGDVALSDTFVENGDTGVTFSVENFSNEGGNVILNYVSTSGAFIPVFTYSVERMVTSYQVVD